MFSRVFKGKDKDKGVTSKPIKATGEAIHKLRETEDMLIKKQQFLESKIKKEIEIAKANGTKNKREALQALKRKKRYEITLQQIDGTLSTIELQREALEGANTNTAVLNSMSAGAGALKKVHKKMDIGKVDDLMDDINEQMEFSNEFSDAISKPYSLGQDIDEDDLLRELEELEQEELSEELLSLEIKSVPTTKFPSTPSNILGQKSKGRRFTQEEEDDMSELQSWAT